MNEMHKLVLVVRVDMDDEIPAGVWIPMNYSNNPSVMEAANKVQDAINVLQAEIDRASMALLAASAKPL